MKTAKPSVMAAIMAFHRALEMLYPEADQVCRDPLAVRFLPPDWAGLLEDREQLMAVMGEKARQFPGVNGAIVSRVRFIDDVVKKALAEGLEQLVILGAGYDSRAYRIDGLVDRVTVFELDDPITQTDKRAKLATILGGRPDHVRFIALDVEADAIGDRLTEKGYDVSKKSLFILEGVVPYINADAFGEILAMIAEINGAGNELVFDYLPPSVIDGSCQWEEGRNMVREVASHGEAFKLGFEKEALEALLCARGFAVLENINAPDLRERYFHGASTRRPITPVFWFVHAACGQPCV